MTLGAAGAAAPAAPSVTVDYILQRRQVRVRVRVANLLPSSRSKIDVLQLVLLCKNVDFVSIGSGKVFAPLISDLKSLQTDGIDLGPQFGIRKGTVVHVLGDNLGSHMIGGFVQNFSGTYFCRYCLATKDCLITGLCHPDNFEKRTPDNYNSTIFELQQGEYCEVLSAILCCMICLTFTYVHQLCHPALDMTCLRVLSLMI